MPPAVQSMIAVTYVTDMEAARSFYELLGFRAQSAGEADTSAWLVLRHGPHTVLLAYTRPAVRLPGLPLLFYFYYEDLAEVLRTLEAAGTEVVRLGYAPHAQGGEARVRDPDGNTILLGQRAGPGPAPSSEGQDETSRFSLLREAAVAASADAKPATACELSSAAGQPCAELAEVRLADSAGTAIWACIAHAEEILVMVPGAFVASEEDTGIANYLARRHG